MSEQTWPGKGKPAPPVVAPLYPTCRTYPLIATTSDVPSGAFPTGDVWRRAFRAHTFFANGEAEPQDRRTSFRMLRGDDVLFVAVQCPTSGGRAVDGESIEFYLTQSDRADFPYIVATVTADGHLSVGIVSRPHSPWQDVPVDPVPDGSIRHEVNPSEDGWEAVLALSLSALGMPADGFHFNIVRPTGEDGAYAWCDLFAGPRSQVEIFARAVQADDATPWTCGLAFPAEVAVGVNHVRVEGPEVPVTWRLVDSCGGPPDMRLADGSGEVVLTVSGRGPLALEAATDDGQTIAVYRAEVRRPFLIHAQEPFLPADASEFALDVTLNVAATEPVPVTVTCTREGGTAETHRLDLAPGGHSVRLPIPAGAAGEVSVEASAAVPAAGDAITLEARHWFCVGVAESHVDVYRDGIRDLPTDRMYWALLADAVPLRRLRQAGVGAYGRTDRSQSSMWDQSSVYAVALLYKTEAPENPFAGDRRLLQSAVMGMEFGLRPEVSMEEHTCPDNRSLQAYLLAYELLKDEVEPERGDYWAHELERRADGVVKRWLRALADKTALYSVDCGTGTNHMVYHIANVYLAGCLFDNREWKDLGRMFMRRLARHGAEGNFEERQGLPVNHYTWLSGNGVSEYYERSGDVEMEATLEAIARYETAITTPRGEVMSLHDGRNSHQRSSFTGNYVLSWTPEGRSAARTLLLRCMFDRPSRVRLESLWRCAESAVYLRPGPESDFMADNEFQFSHGVIARRSGFQYGLSTICLGPINMRFRLDPQNVVELFHRGAGCILHGGNSTLQPEAGTFCRPLDDAPTVHGLAAPTAPRVDYLPITATVSRLPSGHDVTLTYWTFRVRLAVHILSPTEARVVVTPKVTAGDGPVTFNFFPAVAESDELEVDGGVLHVGAVRLRPSKEVAVERDFRIMNPYQIEFTSSHKPVRCWVLLESDETFVLDVTVDTSAE